MLLVGLGISSMISARFPYPAVRPGDSPFAQPQSASTAGSVVQSLSFIATALSIGADRRAGVAGRARQPGYHWLALAGALVLGFSVLAIGVTVRRPHVERSGPELLALAMRN